MEANANRRASWSWRLQGQRARDLASLLLNLLHEKHTQALALLASANDEVKVFLKNDKRKHYEHLRRN